MLTVGSLFSGIGGFDLGLERAGMRVIWQSEIDPYASAVLRKHWPDVPNHGDVRSIRAGDVEPVDVLCGGFPCQDISNAGKRAGIDGERSGLWSEFARVIGELRPRYVIVENVAALLGRGIERVLGDLAALGFDAEWHCIPASAVGAPHRRDRVWIIARDTQCNNYVNGFAESSVIDGSGWTSWKRTQLHLERNASDATDTASACDVANASELRCERNQPFSRSNGASKNQGRMREPERDSKALADADTPGRADIQGRYALAEFVRDRAISDPGWWLTEPDVGRVAHGVPARVDRLRCLGNAIVPQIAEIIGRAIVRAAA